MSRRSILFRLAREARPYYPRIAVAMAMGVLAGVLSIVPPLAFRIIINQVLVPPAGHAPDLHALYLSLGITSVALVARERGDLRADVPDRLERAASGRAAARASFRAAAEPAASGSSTSGARAS